MPKPLIAARFAAIAFTLCISCVAAPVNAQGTATAATQAELKESDMARAKHADWTRLLARYVRAFDDGVARFDYGALAANRADRAALDAYIARFAETDLSARTGANFASWANLYNAVTVRHIIERYPVRSIRDGYLFGPWKQVKVRAGGREVSLDAIEHDILRVHWGTPEVHYALNCASYSCPNLPAFAWEAATLEADLAKAARDYVNHPRGVTVGRRGLTVSSIYKWFEKDFGGTEQAVIDHLLAHAEPDLAAKIRANPRIARNTYDWSLNDASATGPR